MVNDNQVRKLMKLINEGDSLAVAAAKSGLSEPTARKYIRAGRLPSHLKSPRTYRTRPDPFSEVWPEIEPLLQVDPSIEAVTIFDYLSSKYEGRFSCSQLRTLQRRIKVWKATSGPKREVFFPQQHIPGRLSQSDFTWMNDLQISIAGARFDHLLYHFTLTYSNWESVSLCFSESFESLSAGLQNALWELGVVPQEHRTDSLSAAVSPPSSRQEFTLRYQGLLDHYGLKASHSSPGRPNENGDIEQSHHRFKRAVGQELLLRGSRDFSSRKEYEDFLHRLASRRNSARRSSLIEEKEVMRSLPQRRAEDYTVSHYKVSRNSTIHIRKNIYSVPSQLIGERVEARVFAEEIELWYAGSFIERLPRVRGEGHSRVNYRHVIHSLVRKPGAFASYRYRESLFPSLIFRIAYDLLGELQPGKADRQYLKILNLAAKVSEEKVGCSLQQLIEKGEEVSFEKVEQMVLEQEFKLSPLSLGRVEEVELESYDQLLCAAQQEEVG
jgi:hypothetical protein